jgi:hypothetical protein
LENPEARVWIIILCEFSLRRHRKPRKGQQDQKQKEGTRSKTRRKSRNEVHSQEQEKMSKLQEHKI